MKTKLLLRVSYDFDKPNVYLDSNLQIQRTSFEYEGLTALKVGLKNYISEVDYVEFTKDVGQPMYVDLADGTAKQTGYVFRISTELDNKKYRGNCWVQIEQINDFNF